MNRLDDNECHRSARVLEPKSELLLECYGERGTINGTIGGAANVARYPFEIEVVATRQSG